MKWFGGRWPKSFARDGRDSWPEWLRTRRGDLRIALMLLGLIVLPSAVLGLLSWRAIQTERSYAKERLGESYRRFARLARQEIDLRLREAEARWTRDIERAVFEGASPESLARHAGREPLVAGYFLLPRPGRITYPPVAAGSRPVSPAPWAPELHVLEYETFTTLVARGEELEYQDGNLPAAIDAYREIIGAVQDPKLRAIAESYVGRAQLKHGESAAAITTYRDLLARHPEQRDLNKMYLRLLAQYQIGVAYEALGRERDALETLLALHEDLLRRSDAMNALQYSYYSDLIQAFVPRLLSTPHLRDRARYEQHFRALSERSKKAIGQRYVLQVLDSELSELVVRRRHFSTRIHYLSDRAGGEPFLLAYRALPDSGGAFVNGVLAVQIDLNQLRDELFPAILRNLKPDDEVGLAILGPAGSPVIGEATTGRDPIAAEDLADPFDFWQVAVYLKDVPGALRRIDFRSTLWLWLVSVLLLVILLGASVLIRRARREAYLSRARSSFVSNVTHELRTPLASIRMFAELLEMELEDPGRPLGSDFRDKSMQYLGLIRKQSERLSRLIESVLDFSRMEHHQRRFRFERRDATEILRHTLDTFRPHAEREGFRLQLTTPEGPIPELLLDADALEQVFFNLLQNAVQYSEDTKSIDVIMRREGDTLAIDVVDHGIGIAPRDLARVFDEFYSGRQRMDARAQVGLGLGLTLARGIARAHGGDIRVRSEPGRGSTFTVVLPIPATAGDTGHSGHDERRMEPWRDLAPPEPSNKPAASGRG